MNSLFCESNNLKVALAPVALTGGKASAKISMAQSHRLAIMVSMAAFAGNVAIGLKQYNGGVSKDLVIENPFFTKADGETIFTKNELASAAISLTQFDAKSGVAVIEILSSDLDEGFSEVELTFGDVGRVASAMYIQSEPKFCPAYTVAI